MAIYIGAMARNAGRIESLGESTFANGSEGIWWHIMNGIGITMAADANGVEWAQPSVIGITESSSCVIAGAGQGATGGSVKCWGNISEAMMKLMGRPVACSNGKIVDSIRRLLPLVVKGGMRFQKLGSSEGTFASCMKAYEDWDWVGCLCPMVSAQRVAQSARDKKKKPTRPQRAQHHADMHAVTS